MANQYDWGISRILESAAGIRQSAQIENQRLQQLAQQRDVEEQRNLQREKFEFDREQTLKKLSQDRKSTRLNSSH